MDNEQTKTESVTPEPITREHVVIVKARNKRISLIMISLCICFVLAAVVITAVHQYRAIPKDDGLILDNVTVGGMNIGGMTPENAKNAIILSIESVLTQEDMVVRLEYDALTISPADIGLTLDVDKLIQVAYNYGRSGSNAQNRQTRALAKKQAHHIALLPYMQMDLNKVYDQIKAFCSSYRTDLIQPSVSLSGTRPSYGQTDVTHQTLTITIGTPQSNLTPDDLYKEVLDGYSLFQLELYYTPPVVVEPAAPSAQEIFDAYCLAPKDATIDSKTFAVTPEVYGYGFNVAAIQRRIDRAVENKNYGQKIDVTLEFLMPDITAEALAGNLFKDTLASYTSYCPDPTDKNRNKNLSLACQSIDGYVIKVGEQFDFNAIIGTLSTVQGYVYAPTYSGSSTSTVGGGISQIASALHYCALLSELQINQRTAHRYAVSYTPIGTDAAISSTENLVFTNTTTAPIRVLASVSGSTVTIKFLGTKAGNYKTVIESEFLNTFVPVTSYQLMAADNPYGYKEGQVLQRGLTGYEIQLYICRYNASGTLISKVALDPITYASRDEIVVRIGSNETPGEEIPDDGIIT